jgi:hypothetical protein
MRKVMIGTPSYDGRLEAFYVNALRRTEAYCKQHGIEFTPVFLCYDSLVQRARNDIVRLAVEGGFDDLFFIDSDIEWESEWVLSLLNRPVDCVGTAYRKKTDAQELYTVRSRVPVPMEDGLCVVEGVGTGFVRLSRKAFTALWDSSDEYENEGRKCRWIFDVCVLDGKLVSEDNIMCEKLRRLGMKVYVDPSFTPSHIGMKKYQGDFASYVARLNQK